MKFNLSFSSGVILEIRDQELRLLVFQNGSLKKATVRPIPAEIIRSGQVQDTKKLGQEIRSFVQNELGNASTLHIVLPGLRTTCRMIDIPRMSGNLRKKFLERQIDKEMPFKAADLYISIFTLSHNGANVENSEQVLLIGTPRSQIDRLKESLYLAGIKRASFTVKPFALAGLVEDKDALIFDLEQDEFNIIVTHGGQPSMVYSRSLDGSSPANEEFQDGGVLAEIQRSYEYLEEFILKNKDFNKLAFYLTGASSRSEKINESVEIMYGRAPVKIGHLKVSLNEKIKNSIETTYHHTLELPAYETALPEEVKSGAYDAGLGLVKLLGKSSGFLSKSHSIPGHISLQDIHGPPGFLQKTGWSSLSYMPLILGISLMAYVYYIYQEQHTLLEQRRDEMERFQTQETAQRRFLLSEKKLDNDAKKIQSSLNQLLKEYSEIDKKTLDYRETIQYVTDQATMVSISNAAIKENKLTLSGTSAAIQSVLEYAAILGKNNSITAIRIPSINASGTGQANPAEYSFTLVAEISKSNIFPGQDALSAPLKETVRASISPK